MFEEMAVITNLWGGVPMAKTTLPLLVGFTRSSHMTATNQSRAVEAVTQSECSILLSDAIS